MDEADGLKFMLLSSKERVIAGRLEGDGQNARKIYDLTRSSSPLITNSHTH